ncbi:hypothetical protein HDU89_000657 [Geranomyces variabilis]|nr:hypothetical protein HDU89_000657 [Geranomyces variabilis]
MSVAIELTKSLTKIAGKTQKDRDAGIADLRVLLSRSALTDTEYRSIFGVVCDCLYKAKEEYFQRKTQAAAAKAEKSLTDLSQLFRWLCEQAGNRLEKSLGKPILQHVLEADLERNCKRLYDCALRELKSKLGVSRIDNMEEFALCVCPEWTKHTMLPLLRNSGQNGSQLHVAYAFLDWSADVFFNLLHIEQRSLTSRYDSPRVSKRPRRELTLMQDFDRIMDAKTPRDERIGLLQVLAVMIAKHGHKMEEDSSTLLTAKLEGLLGDGEVEMAAWALMCWANLPASGRSQRLSGWNLALKLIVADTPSATAGFYVLERELERSLMATNDVVDAFARAGNAVINGAMLSGSSMTRFFTAYLKWSALKSRESATQSVLECNLFAWLLKDRSSNVQSVLEYYTAMSGAFGIKEQAIHCELARTEEFLSEQRLLSSRRLCKLAAEEDIGALAENERSKLCTPQLDPRLAAVLRDHAAMVLEQWQSKGASKHLMTESLAVFLCGLASAQLSVKGSPLASKEAQVLLLFTGKVAEYMAEALFKLPAREATAFLSELARGLAAVATFRASGNAEIESAVSDAATPLVRTLAAALRSRSADMILDAPSTSLAQNDPKSLDDFDAPVVASVNNASGAAQAVLIGGQLQFYYDPSALEGAQMARDTVLEYRCLGLLCQLLWPNYVEDKSRDLWREACDAMMETLPESLDGITIRGDDAIDFLKFSAARGLCASMKTKFRVIATNIDLQSFYDSQFDPRFWTYAVQSLAAILPALVQKRNHTDLIVSARPLVTRFFQYLQKRVAPSSTCAAIITFIVRYLAVDPDQTLFGLEEGLDSTMKAYLDLLTHEEFLVRMAAVRTIPELFAIFPAVDHHAIFLDIRDAPAAAIANGAVRSSLPFLDMCTSILALGEIVSNVPHQRVGAALQLLVIAAGEPQNWQLVHEVFEVHTIRLALPSAGHLLDALLPSLFWAWEGELDTFPIRLFVDFEEQDETAVKLMDRFLRRRLDLVLSKLLVQGDVTAAETLRKQLGKDSTELFRQAIVPVMAHLLPMHVGDTEAATKARTSFTFLEGIFGGPDSLSQMLSSDLPGVAAHIFKISPEADSVRKTLVLFASLRGAEEKSFDDFFSPTTTAIILQTLNEELESLLFAEDRLRLLNNGYSLFVRLAASKIAAEIFLFRSVLQQLVRSMAASTMCEAAASIFAFICDVAIEHHAEIVGPTIASIVPALAQMAVRHGPGAETLLDTLQRSLDLAAKCDPAAARLAVLQLDAAALGPAFAQKFENLLINSIPGDPEIALKLLAAGDPTPFAQLGRAKYLRRALETTNMSIQLADEQETVNEMVNHLLAMLHGTQPAEELVVTVGHCIGRLAPLLRGRISDNVQESWALRRGEVESGKGQLAGQLLALACLEKYLFHEDVRTVGCIIKTLSAILALPDGAAALDILRGTRSAGVLQMFHSTDTSAVAGSAVAAQEAYPLLAEGCLWNGLLLEAKENENGSSTQPTSSHKPLMCVANSLLKTYATSAFYMNLGLAFERVPEFAEVMLPDLVHGALEHEVCNGSSVLRKRDTETVRDLLSVRFQSLFQQAEQLKPGILPALLKIVEVLRVRVHPNATCPFDNNYWLSLDYLAVGNAAALNSSYASAVLFLEIANEATHSAWNPKVGLSRAKRARNDHKGQDSISVFESLLKVYQSMGDSDGFEGVIACLGSKASLDGDVALVRKYEHENSWGRILSIRETQLGIARGNAEEERSVQLGLMRAMSKMGLHNTLETYILGSGNAGGASVPEEIRDLHYECMWRNGLWDAPDRTPEAFVGKSQQLYRCLKAHHEHDTAMSSFLSSALVHHVRELRSVSVHGALNPFPMLRFLTLVSEMDELAGAATSSGIEATLRVWDLRLSNLVESQNFSDLEPVLALRTATLQILVEHERSETGIENVATAALCKHLLTSSRIARQAGNLQTAQTAVAQLTKIVDSAKLVGFKNIADLEGLVKLELLRILWSQGDNQAVVTRSLEHFIGVHATGSKSVESQLLCQFAQWTAESRYETPTTVMKERFDPAIEAAAAANDPTLQAKGHYYLARFADAQYEELMANDPTEELQEQIRYNERQRQACEHFIAQAVGVKPSVAQEFTYERNRIEAQIKLDAADEQRYHADKNHFLQRSVENYLAALELGRRGGDADASVFRLCALWLSNYRNSCVNNLVRRHIHGANFRSSAFLIPIYQLSARLSANATDSERDFQEALMMLLYAVVRDHPHHGLYQIIALKNGGHTTSGSSSSTRRARPTAEKLPATVEAASQLLQRLRNSPFPVGLGQLVDRVDRLSDAYIDLARRRIDSTSFPNPKVRELKLEPRSALAAIAATGVDVPLPTIEHPVRDDRDYANLPRIAGFDEVFSCPGGVNLPRRLVCRGSDGKLYTQLVKGGRDDLRQDAVLAKIFTVMNVLLRRNLATRKRNLSLRTYKVVPLAPTGGLVEWVDNTTPLLQCLSDGHRRYNPGDWRSSECRQRMEGFRNRSPDEKLKMYQHIENNFKPVFRHFFYENFPSPVDWSVFEHRVAYTRSVAASSVAGYAVGLGDRHGSNILIDKGTAEVVHIDLGIAFDQGKVLPIPELVPFRLSRDMVDGMGITGVEGAFRKGSEEVLNVLCEGSELLMTILDVFRYDPLYTWKMTPEERRRRQGGEKDPLAIAAAGTDNQAQSRDAERALFAVRKRLSPAVTAKCRVAELIQAATDPAKLCRMYEGWQAWM